MIGLLTLNSFSNPAIGKLIERQLQERAELYSDPLLTGKEVRDVLRCSYSHLRKLIVTGRLPAWRPTPTGQYRVRQSALRTFIEKGDLQ